VYFREVLIKLAACPGKEQLWLSELSRRVRISLKESSSEAEEDDESAAAITIDSDVGNEGAIDV
jgi:hypothetical protein